MNSVLLSVQTLRTEWFSLRLRVSYVRAMLLKSDRSTAVGDWES